jgi:manganese/zinc/iron transport system permease protein
LAGAIGAISGWFGSAFSALMPRLPAGAVIVLMAAMIFLISMCFGTARGVLLRWRSHHRLKRKIGRQHILRAMYEVLEKQSGRPEGDLPGNQGVLRLDVLAKRSWNERGFHRLVSQARREDHVEVLSDGSIRLTESGFGEAARITRNHRLWETYLITHADVAPQHVDRDADQVEHVLGPELVAKLERRLAADGHPLFSIPSPHEIARSMEKK